MINSFLQKLSTWVTAKSNISTRIDFLLLTSVRFLRAIPICNTFNPDCGYDINTIILIGYVYCPNTKCLGKFCLHKNTFQSLGRSDYQCPQCGSGCQVRNILLEVQTNSFFLSLGQGVYIFEESPKSVQDVTGDVFCAGKYCFNREKCESLGEYVATRRSFCGCGKCRARLFVDEVPFVLKKHLNTTQTDKTRFFFAKKIWTCYPTFVHQNPFSEEEQFPTNHSHPHQKKLKWVQLWNERIRFLLADDLSNIFVYQIFSLNFNLLSTSQI